MLPTIERARMLQLLRDRIARRPSTLAAGLPTLGRAAAQLIEEMLADSVGTPFDIAGGPPTERVADHPRHLPPPLVMVAARFDLRWFEYDALILAVLAEIDWRIGRALAYLQDNPALTRPTLGLALALSTGGHAPSIFALCDGPLVRDGLLVCDGAGSLAERTLRATADVARRLCDPDPMSCGVQVEQAAPDVLAHLVLDQTTLEATTAWAMAARRGSPRPFFVVGPPGSGRRTLARAAAGAAGWPIVAVEATADDERLLVSRRDSLWYGATILVDATQPIDAIRWRAVWRTFADLQRPLIVVLPREHVEAASVMSASIVSLETSEAQTRRRLWRTLVPADVPDEAVDGLATRFSFGPARISRVVARAAGEDASSPVPSMPTLLQCAREIGRASLGNLAERLPLPFARNDLVVADTVHAELDLAASWLRHERRVQDDWGLRRRIGHGHGLTIMFVGEPGTGKTMAAQVLAAELDLELYRIDLSRVLSKYIGETEKNLAQLFEEARSSGVILFFDEGEALFGKRTETQSAHDRYANVEIAYLLQRMELHDGVTILATNRVKDMDEAFIRRFHIYADFRLPDRAQRLKIWQRLLAPPVQCSPDLPLQRLSYELELSGGQIRNVALAAAYLAASNDRAITLADVEHAVRREIKRHGKVVDQRVFGAPSAQSLRR